MIRTGKFIVHYDDEKDHRRIWRGGTGGLPMEKLGSLAGKK